MRNEAVYRNVGLATQNQDGVLICPHDLSIVETSRSTTPTVPARYLQQKQYQEAARNNQGANELWSLTKPQQ